MHLHKFMSSQKKKKKYKLSIIFSVAYSSCLIYLHISNASFCIFVSIHEKYTKRYQSSAKVFTIMQMTYLVMLSNNMERIQ